MQQRVYPTKVLNVDKLRQPLLNVCYWQNIEQCAIINPLTNEKALGETQTLRADRSNAEPKTFAPPQTPFPGAQDRQNLIS